MPAMKTALESAVRSSPSAISIRTASRRSSPASIRRTRSTMRWWSVIVGARGRNPAGRGTVGPPARGAAPAGAGRRPRHRRVPARRAGRGASFVGGDCRRASGWCDEDRPSLSAPSSPVSAAPRSPRRAAGPTAMGRTPLGGRAVFHVPVADQRARSARPPRPRGRALREVGRSGSVVRDRQQRRALPHARRGPCPRARPGRRWCTSARACGTARLAALDARDVGLLGRARARPAAPSAQLADVPKPTLRSR